MSKSRLFSALIFRTERYIRRMPWYIPTDFHVPPLYINDKNYKGFELIYGKRTSKKGVEMFIAPCKYFNDE